MRIILAATLAAFISTTALASSGDGMMSHGNPHAGVETYAGGGFEGLTLIQALTGLNYWDMRAAGTVTKRRDIVNYSRSRGRDAHRARDLARLRAMQDLVDGHRGTTGSVGMSGNFSAGGSWPD